MVSLEAEAKHAISGREWRPQKDSPRVISRDYAWFTAKSQIDEADNARLVLFEECHKLLRFHVENSEQLLLGMRLMSDEESSGWSLHYYEYIELS